MPPLRQGAIGILPAGALGVSLFYHLTAELRTVLSLSHPMGEGQGEGEGEGGQVSLSHPMGEGKGEGIYFVARAGSASSHALSAAGATLRIAAADGVHELPA